jgi:hypothetical protein
MRRLPPQRAGVTPSTVAAPPLVTGATLSLAVLGAFFARMHAGDGAEGRVPRAS